MVAVFVETDSKEIAVIDALTVISVTPIVDPAIVTLTAQILVNVARKELVNAIIADSVPAK